MSNPIYPKVFRDTIYAVRFSAEVMWFYYGGWYLWGSQKRAPAKLARYLDGFFGWKEQKE